MNVHAESYARLICELQENLKISKYSKYLTICGCLYDNELGLYWRTTICSCCCLSEGSLTGASEIDATLSNTRNTRSMRHVHKFALEKLKCDDVFPHCSLVRLMHRAVQTEATMLIRCRGNLDTNSKCQTRKNRFAYFHMLSSIVSYCYVVSFFLQVKTPMHVSPDRGGSLSLLELLIPTHPDAQASLPQYRSA